MRNNKNILSKLFRLKEWLLVKLLFNLAIGLFLLLSANVGLIAMAMPLMLIIFYITTVGAFGYFINDLFDKEADLKSGKADSKMHLSLTARIIIPICLLAVASLPFVFLLETPGKYLVFLFIHAALLFTYSVPGIKLKTNTWALLWDALYSYVMPALITMEVVRQCCGIHDLTLVQKIVPIIWLLLIGIRSLLNHQLKDIKADTMAGIKTFVITTGSKTAYSISVIVTSLEIIIFAILVIAIFDVLWKIVILALLLFAVVEIILLNKTFNKMFNDGKIWAIINQFYDYYLFMGILLWMAWKIHPAFVVVPVFFIIYRLSAHTWFYHHFILWFYFKIRGAESKIAENRKKKSSD